MKYTIGALTVAAGLALGTSAFAAGSTQTDKVKLEELPQQVQSTVNQHVEGGKVKKIERITENGQTFYEVSFKNSAGDKQQFRIDSNGQYQGPQTEKQGMQPNSHPQTTPTSAGQQPPAEPQR